MIFLTKIDKKSLISLIIIIKKILKQHIINYII